MVLISSHLLRKIFYCHWANFNICHSASFWENHFGEGGEHGMDGQPQSSGPNQLSGIALRQCLSQSVAMRPNFDATIGQYLVPDRNSACTFLIGHKASDTQWVSWCTLAWSWLPKTDGWRWSKPRLFGTQHTAYFPLHHPWHHLMSVDDTPFKLWS